MNSEDFWEQLTEVNISRFNSKKGKIQN